MFLQLIDTHFPLANKLHKIFNRNTIKVSYSCTGNLSQITTGHNKKVTQIKRHHQLDCNCRIKAESPLNGDCRKEGVIYMCTALTTFQPKKVYLGLAKGEFSKRELFKQYNSLHLYLENEDNEKGNTNISVGNNSNCCTIHKHIKATFFMSPREISYTHVSKSECTFKRSELVSKCRHENKFLSQTLSSND